MELIKLLNILQEIAHDGHAMKEISFTTNKGLKLDFDELKLIDDKININFEEL